MTEEGDPLPEQCRGCGTADRVSWSALFGWLCPGCQWSRTEAYFLLQPVTAPPDGGREP